MFCYHALFRAFLKAQASRDLGDETSLAMQRRAARLLDARGHHDDAFRIFSEVQDWPSARRLIERHAHDLLAKGRAKTLQDWIDALPQGVLDAALSCYRHGIDVNEMAEGLYQGAMRCHAALGRDAEGIATFR